MHSRHCWLSLLSWLSLIDCKILLAMTEHNHQTRCSVLYNGCESYVVDSFPHPLLTEHSTTQTLYRRSICRTRWRSLTIHALPLEVRPSDAPELNHDPRSYPPEVTFAQGLGSINEISNGKAENEEGYREKQHTITVNYDWVYIKWRWIALVVGILCIGGIAGGVGGSFRNKSR